MTVYGTLTLDVFWLWGSCCLTGQLGRICARLVGWLGWNVAGERNFQFDTGYITLMLHDSRSMCTVCWDPRYCNMWKSCLQDEWIQTKAFRTFRCNMSSQGFNFNGPADAIKALSGRPPCINSSVEWYGGYHATNVNRVARHSQNNNDQQEER